MVGLTPRGRDHSGVAQSVEQRAVNAMVVGSSPSAGAMYYSKLGLGRPMRGPVSRPCKGDLKWQRRRPRLRQPLGDSLEATSGPVLSSSTCSPTPRPAHCGSLRSSRSSRSTCGFSRNANGVLHTGRVSGAAMARTSTLTANPYTSMCGRKTLSRVGCRAVGAGRTHRSATYAEATGPGRRVFSRVSPGHYMGEGI